MCERNWINKCGFTIAIASLNKSKSVKSSQADWNLALGLACICSICSEIYTSSSSSSSSSLGCTPAGFSSKTTAWKVATFGTFPRNYWGYSFFQPDQPVNGWNPVPPKMSKKLLNPVKLCKQKEIVHIQLHNLPDFIHPSTISQTNEFWKPHPAATYDPPGRHQPNAPGQPETSYNLRGKLGAHWAQYPGARFGFWRGLWVGEEAYIKDTCIYIYIHIYVYMCIYIYIFFFLLYIMEKMICLCIWYVNSKDIEYQTQYIICLHYTSDHDI